MAGDWIKVEVATIDKPEVIRMAELLGVKRDEMVGILFRFWVWLDRSTGNGVVTHMSRIGVDQVMQCTGFSAALESVGWCEFDESAVTLTVPNFCRHNGTPAKSRALGNERKARYDERKRNATGVTKTYLREEKRREEITTSLRSVVKSAINEPTAEHEALAQTLGINCKAEFQKYRDYLAASGKRHKDEAAGFRNWLRKAKEFSKPIPLRPQSIHDKRAATAAAMYGDLVRDINERHDIPGESERVA